MWPGSQQQRAERALDRSTAVFAGQVANISKGSPLPGSPARASVSFRVSKVWKGPEQETLEVTTPRGRPACGYPFSEGRKYLVYAEGKNMSVNACGETTPLSKASAALAALGDGGVLSDTSGGSPARDSWDVGAGGCGDVIRVIGAAYAVGSDQLGQGATSENFYFSSADQ